jgi:hypothetical protein
VHAFKDDGRKSVRRLDGCESSKRNWGRLILFFRVLPQRVVWLSSIKAKKKIGAESENKEGGFVFMTIADNTRRKEENI